MAEKQVLFRIEGKLLDSLDKKITKDGYSTRNAWFKEVVTGYAGGPAKAPKAAKAAKPAKAAKAAKAPKAAKAKRGKAGKAKKSRK